ncbi:MAG: response regulator [Anaerolineae bacterium]
MPKILVVEDEVQIREEVMDWLMFEGYEVTGAENGARALEAVGHELPDLILSDIRMPEMDGIQFLLEIRSNRDYMQIPFIFLTASAERDSVRRGMTTGADDYLTKPFTHTEILNAVTTQLLKKEAQDQLKKSQLENLEAALGEEREKLHLTTRLVAMFSHDFRNPLSSILSSSDMIRRYEDRMTPERKVQYLDRINAAVLLLKQMLDDMLLTAEMEEGYLQYTPQQMDFNGFVQTLVDEFTAMDNQAHSIMFSGAMLDLGEGDPRLLRQMLANLLSNALKYSPGGSAVMVGLFRDGDTIHFLVQDQGIGIPDSAKERLFQPFFRAENAGEIQGTGLGLSIVKACAELHGGCVYLDSEEGVGTRATVVIPRR